jgi:hypothetical protein
MTDLIKALRERPRMRFAAINLRRSLLVDLLAGFGGVFEGVRD